MQESGNKSNGSSKLAIAAGFFLFIGISDFVFFSNYHFSREAGPCRPVTGCETVLTSQYAEMFGIPTAAFGALAYFAAFSFAVLAVFGNRKMWDVFGVAVSVMMVFTIYLIYLQAYVIGAFCQFCLLSAATTLTLFIIYLASLFYRSR